MRWRLLLPAAAALAACQIFVDLHDEPGGAAPPPYEPCAPFVPPPPPASVGTDGGAEDGLYFFAVSSMTFTPPGRPLPGFDLDDRCTGLDGSARKGSSCIRPAGAAPDIDLDGGVDDALAVFLGGVGTGNDAFSRYVNNQIEPGKFSFLIQLTRYNGLADDDDVSVGFINVTAPVAQLPEGGTVAYPPTFTPDKDTWNYYADNAIPEIANPPVTTATLPAHVTNGVLALTNGSAIAFRFSSSTVLALSHVSFTASIVRDGDSFSLANTNVGGVATVSSLLAILGNFVTELADAGDTCVSPVDTASRNQFCLLRDIRVDLDASAPCDALSFGVSFEAVRAKIGVKVSVPENPCADAGVMTCE